MNEKTKQILRYVACGLGGCALGIGLLGGLSMCATSNNTKAESVNTIYASPKREQITTTDGGFSGYAFQIDSDWASTDGVLNWHVYTVNYSTFTLIPSSTGSVNSVNDWSSFQSAVSSVYNSNKTAVRDGLMFMSAWGYTNNTYSAYFTFILPDNETYSYQPHSFIKTNWTGTNVSGLRFDSNYWAWTTNSSDSYLLTYEQSNVIITQSNLTSPPVTYVRFQDVESYYRSLGYGAGYDEGYVDGNNVGYWQGYNEGVGTAGNFTNISGNINALIDLYPLGVSTTGGYSHGLTDTKYYTLLQFRDQEQESWTVQIEDGIASDQPSGTRTAYINLFSPNEGYKGWLGYAVRDSSISTFKVQQTNEFSFEFATVYNVLGASLTKEYVLIWGWASDNVSYQAGYNAGYQDGFDGTNVNNVFALFTNAFNSVGGIFNLKVFGFLPLYWFFLAPVFIALITLLIRMVKH